MITIFIRRAGAVGRGERADQHLLQRRQPQRGPNRIVNDNNNNNNNKIIIIIIINNHDNNNNYYNENLLQRRQPQRGRFATAALVIFF